MKKIPWTAIGTACLVMVVLVIGRCAVTAGRVLYYGGTNWKDKIMEDPWLIVGVVASVVCVLAFLMADTPKKKHKSEET